MHGEISGFGAGMPNMNDLPIAQSETILREKCLRNSGSNDSYNIIVVSSLIFSSVSNDLAHK